MSDQRQRDPFAPVEGVVTVALNFVIVLTVFVLGLMLVQLLARGHTDASLATIGDREACATVPTSSVPYSYDSSEPGLNNDGVSGLDKDARALSRQIEICLEHPTFFVKAASTVTPVGGLIFMLGGLVLVRRVIRTGRRHGLFTREVARRTRVLGWFVLVMAGVYPLVAAAGRGVVVAEAVRGETWTGALASPGISVTIVIVGLGVITFARIMDRAIPLQEEVDATV